MTIQTTNAAGDQTLPSKGNTVTRWLVAGPLTLIVSILTMAGMSAWLPKGSAGIDHLAFPIILFPAIWSVLFFYAVLESKPWRAGLIILMLGVVNGFPVYRAISAMTAG